jgi:RHS repeat-associated protein
VGVFYRRPASQLALLMGAVVAASLLATPAAQASSGSQATVVLDPDHGYANAIHDGVSYNSFPFNLAIAQAVQAQLPSVCNANVALTQTTDSLSNAQRAAKMTKADVSVTLSLDALNGVDWGTQSEGGAKSFATSAGDNLAFGDELASQMSSFTGRPFTAVNQGPTNGTHYPYPEFAALPGTYAHIFMLYLDESYDWPVVRDAQDLMVNAVVTSLAHELQAQGFQCLGTFPSRPDAARLQQLRNLGYQRFLSYNGEPVSMSTGNFSTAERTFKLPGVGDQQLDLTLNYNAQSGQNSPVGFGWQFAYSAFLQQYSDGSVLVTLPDGRTLLYTADGSSGFTSPAGAFATLTQLDSSTFRWATATGTSLTFVQDSSGRGMLTTAKDRQGNTITLTYSGAGSLFPNVTAITDQAGQHIAVSTDGTGRITSFTRPDGAVWQLGYSVAGDLTSITSARGTKRHFNYDDQHRMTSEVGQDGVTFLTNTYDSASRVIDQTNALGHHRTLAYNDADRTTTFTDTTGATSVYHWNALGEVTQIDDALGGVTQTTYNGALLPTVQTNPLNKATHRDYDPSGQPSSVTDPLGNTATATYDTAGDLTSTTDAGGPGAGSRTYSYNVNGQGLPTTVTNPDGTTQHRTYDAVGDLASSSDETGATTSYHYDSRGNVISITDPLGRVTTMAYDVANRMTSVTDPRGHTTSYSYDANDNLTLTAYPNGSSEARHYDVDDQLTSVTDRRGGVTSYSYDAELNLVKIMLPNGGMIRNTFDQEDRLTSTTDPLGNKTSYTLDALGRRTSVTDANGHTAKTGYNAAGQIISQTDAIGATTKYVLDADGRLIKATDPAGGVTTTTWDAVGRKSAITDPNGHTTSFTYSFRDELATSTDPAGDVSTDTYDDAGRLIKTTDALGAVTRYAYDADGELIKSTDAVGDVTTYSYDANGNRTGVTDPNGHTTTTTYDAMSQPISTTDPNGHTHTLHRDAGGLVTLATDALGHSTSHTYDVSGNLTATTDALGRTSHYGYDLDQQRVTQTAPDGIVTLDRFDAVGDLAAVVENFRNAQPASSRVNVTTNYAYDPRNLLTAVTDANSHTTAYGYDARGLPTAVTNPLGKVTAYGYDAAGNRTSRTDANGVTTNYSYNSRDLLGKRAYPDGSSDSFGYDADDRQISATNARGTVATTYDALGRVSQVVDAAGKTLRYSYDPAGNRTGLTLPDTRTLGYHYDPANNLTQLTSPLGTANFTYDAANRLSSVTRPNGTTTTATFDNASELTKLITKAGSSTLTSFAYGYDTAGNVASLSQNLGSKTTNATFAYDPLRRLTSDAGGPLPSTYTYDAAGNRLTWSAPDDPYTPKPADAFTQSNVYNAAGQLTKSTVARQNGNHTDTSVTTDSYDGNGNRMSANTVAQSPGQSTSTNYTFDFENRLVRSLPGSSPQKGNGNDQRDYRRTYDALGRLLTETRATTTTTWTEDGLAPIVASDSSTTLYLRGANGELQGEQATGSAPLWYVSDALDSVLGATNTSAKLVNVTLLTDYGVKLAKSYSRMSFQGQVADPNLPGNGIGNDTPVLSHFYARSYDAATGSWLQADPMSGTVTRPTTFQPYQFVSDNPTGTVDNLGYLSVGVANPGTISSVGVATTYSGGSLQGGNVGAQTLQPTVSAQYLQPTVSAQQLQPTWNPFYRYSRSRTAYGIVDSIQGPLGGSALQGTGAVVTGPTQPIIINGQALFTNGGRTGELPTPSVHDMTWNSLSGWEKFVYQVGNFTGLTNLYEAGAGTSILTNEPVSFWGSLLAGGLKLGGVALAFVGLPEGSLAGEGATGGAAAVAKGEAGVQQSIAAAEARGETILGREITVDTSGARVRPDLLAQDVEGNLKFIESKNGPFASLTPNQEVGYPLLESEGGIPEGLNALNVGLTPGEPIGAVPIQVDWWDLP